MKPPKTWDDGIGRKNFVQCPFGGSVFFEDLSFRVRKSRLIFGSAHFLKKIADFMNQCFKMSPA